jgi:hypothetical protein
VGLRSTWQSQLLARRLIARPPFGDLSFFERGSKVWEEHIQFIVVGEAKFARLCESGVVGSLPQGREISTVSQTPELEEDDSDNSEENEATKCIED